MPMNLLTPIPTRPIVDITLPNAIRPGPTAAAIAAHLIICFCWASSMLLNLSNRPVTFSMNGVMVLATVSPTVYLNTSNDDFSFSTAPPGPDNSALAILFAAPVESFSPAVYCAKVFGDCSIRVSHLPICSFPNIADAADIFSWSFSPAKESCSFFCIVSISSILPVESKKFNPSCFRASAPSFAGEASLARPVFNASAPLDPDMPASPNTSVITARSLNDHPTESSIGPAVDIASNRS